MLSETLRKSVNITLKQASHGFSTCEKSCLPIDTDFPVGILIVNTSNPSELFGSLKVVYGRKAHLSTTLKLYTAAPTRVLQYLNPLLLFRSLWMHRQLTWQFAMREVRSRYQGSQLGLVWSILSPLLMLGIYTFVFGAILKVTWPVMVSDSKMEFALILFTGLIVTNIFLECAGRAATLVTSQPNFVKRVVFPLEILPVAALGSALTLALVTIAVLALLSGILVSGFSVKQALILPVMLPAIFLSLGAGWWLSALGVFLRDIGHFIPAVLQIFTFMTPVFFPMSIVPERYRWALEINPMTAVVEGARRVLLWNQLPELRSWLIAFAISFVFMQTGFAFFMKSKRAFSDVM